MSIVRPATVVAAALLASTARAGDDDAPTLVDLGPGTPGLLGTPVLAADGVPVVDSPFRLLLGGGVTGGLATLFAGPGAGELFVPKLAGSFYPTGPLLSLPLDLGAGGGLALPVVIDASLCGVDVALQAAFLDASAAGGAALTNGLLVGFGVPTGPLFAHDATPVVAARDVAVGDVDGDGVDDLVLASSAAPGGEVLLGRDGALGDAATLDAGGEAVGVALGDLDGDGALDAVFARSDVGALAVALGVGDGTFASPTVTPVGLFPSAVALGDLDGDGDLDVVAPGRDADAVAVALGDGSGALVAAGVHAFGDRPVDVTLADLDVDGSLDLIVAHDSVDGVGVALGDGDGTFATTALFAAAARSQSVVVERVDGDTTLDVIVTGGGVGGAARMLRGQGDGTLGPALAVSAGLSPERCALADLDGDGHLDLAVTDVSRNEVFVRFGGNGGPFGVGLRVAAVPSLDLVTTADVDGDGVLDLVSASLGVVSAVRGDGAGAFDERASVPTSTRAVAVEVVELTGDGVPDLLVAHDLTSSGGGVSLHAGVGDGTFGGPTAIPSDNQIPRDVATADMDGDGLLDVVVGNAVGSVRVRPGSTPGFLTDTGFFGTSGTVDAIDVVDLDGDGARDVLVTSGGVEWLPGAGDGTLGAPTAVGLGIGFAPDVLAADLDGDGILDVLALDFSGDAVVVARGIGGGLFGAPQSFGVGDAPRRMAVGDLDEDGVLDVVAANSGTGAQRGTVALLRGLGDGTFAPATFHGERIGHGLALADVDRDGHVDVVSSDISGGTVSVLLGAGDGTFVAQLDHASERRPDPVTAADLDGDGVPDLVSAHLDDGELTVLVNQLLD